MVLREPYWSGIQKMWAGLRMLHCASLCRGWTALIDVGCEPIGIVFNLSRQAHIEKTIKLY